MVDLKQVWTEIAKSAIIYAIRDFLADFPLSFLSFVFFNEIYISRS